MKAVLQRVTYAKVEVNNNIISEISNGFLVLLGIENGDTSEEIKLLSNKICNLRVFEDDNNRLNLSLLDTKGSILLISNFTLLADCKKGKRPSFSKALSYKDAEIVYEEFYNILVNDFNVPVKKGIFGADMKVSLTNDGPVTIILDTRELRKI